MNVNLDNSRVGEMESNYLAKFWSLIFEFLEFSRVRKFLSSFFNSQKYLSSITFTHLESLFLDLKFLWPVIPRTKIVYLNQNSLFSILPMISPSPPTLWDLNSKKNFRGIEILVIIFSGRIPLLILLFARFQVTALFP